MKFDLICIDMFQTLVNVNSRIDFIWKRILGEKYNEQLALACANSVSNHVINKFHESACSKSEFINLKTMFKPFFKIVLDEMKISFSEEKAVNIFLEEHGYSKPYEDVDNFFSIIGDKIPICLVSDADHEMVEPILKRYKFDNIFISEEVKSYKNSPSSKIFEEVLKHYTINPNRVIHIGDSSSDILGAHRLGIKTCWINRQKTEWKYSPEPDFIINSLDEIINILDIEKVS